MTLKQLLDVTFHQAKINVTITYPYGSDKKQTNVTDHKAVTKEELLELDGVKAILGNEIDFIEPHFNINIQSDAIYSVLNVFVKGE